MKIIELTNEKVAIVDDEDYDTLSLFLWHAIYNNGWYATRHSVRNGNKTTIAMHRSIMGDIPELEVDHINGDGLDNRRENLRWTTRQQNRFNSRGRKDKTSKYKGVYWDKEREKWRCDIKKDGSSKIIGRFDNEVDAAIAYNKKAKEVFGDFAWLNEIDNNEQFDNK